MTTVRVRASSANPGSGFDRFGIALCLYGTFSLEEREEGYGFSGMNGCGAEVLK